jgi:hypothetical protein
MPARWHSSLSKACAVDCAHSPRDIVSRGLMRACDPLRCLARPTIAGIIDYPAGQQMREIAAKRSKEFRAFIANEIVRFL